jgi:hypothetical protein
MSEQAPPDHAPTEQPPSNQSDELSETLKKLAATKGPFAAVEACLTWARQRVEETGELDKLPSALASHGNHFFYYHTFEYLLSAWRYFLPHDPPPKLPKRISWLQDAHRALDVVQRCLAAEKARYDKTRRKIDRVLEMLKEQKKAGAGAPEGEGASIPPDPPPSIPPWPALLSRLDGRAETLLGVCRELRQRIQSGTDTECGTMLKMPALCRRLWEAMGRIGGSVPDAPPWVGMDTTRQEMQFARGEVVQGFPDFSAVHNALNAVEDWSQAHLTNQTEAGCSPADQGDAEQADNELNEREGEILLALLLLKATGKRRAVSRHKAATKADPATKPASYNKAIASLVERKLVESKSGPGGGIWLTSDGMRFAESFQQQGK